MADNPSKERNHIKISRGVGKSSLHTQEKTRGKLWPRGLDSIDRNTSLCRVGWIHGDQARYSVGFISSGVELTSPAILPFHFLRSLIISIVGWFFFVLLCFGLFT